MTTRWKCKSCSIITKQESSVEGKNHFHICIECGDKNLVYKEEDDE